MDHYFLLQLPALPPPLSSTNLTRLSLSTARPFPISHFPPPNSNSTLLLVSSSYIPLISLDFYPRSLGPLQPGLGIIRAPTRPSDSPLLAYISTGIFLALPLHTLHVSCCPSSHLISSRLSCPCDKSTLGQFQLVPAELIQLPCFSWVTRLSQSHRPHPPSWTCQGASPKKRLALSSPTLLQPAGRPI